MPTSHPVLNWKVSIHIMWTQLFPKDPPNNTHSFRLTRLYIRRHQSRTSRPILMNMIIPTSNLIPIRHLHLKPLTPLPIHLQRIIKTPRRDLHQFSIILQTQLPDQKIHQQPPQRRPLDRILIHEPKRLDAHLESRARGRPLAEPVDDGILQAFAAEAVGEDVQLAMGVAGEGFAAVRLVDGPVLVVDPEDVGGEELRVFFDEPDRAFGGFLPGAGEGGVEEGGFGGQEAPVDAEGGTGCANQDGDDFAGEAPGRFC